MLKPYIVRSASVSVITIHFSYFAVFTTLSIFPDMLHDLRAQLRKDLRDLLPRAVVYGPNRRLRASTREPPLHRSTRVSMPVYLVLFSSLDRVAVTEQVSTSLNPTVLGGTLGTLASQVSHGSRARVPGGTSRHAGMSLRHRFTPAYHPVSRGEGGGSCAID